MASATSNQRESIFLPPPSQFLSPISCSHHHCLIVKGDGRVFLIGEFLSSFHSEPLSVDVGIGISVCYATCGYCTSFIIDREGRVYAWGQTHLGTGTAFGSAKPVLLPLVNISYIYASNTHTVALNSSGDLFTWGSNDCGQLGHGDTQHRFVPSPLSSLPPMSIVSCGTNYTVCISTSGELYSFGSGEKGQTGLKTTENILLPTRIELDLSYPFIFVSCGSSHTLALNEGGQVFSWGNNFNGCLAQRNVAVQHFPSQIESLSGISYISSGSSHSGACGGGKVFTWGGNFYGQLGYTSLATQNYPKCVEGIPDSYFVACGGSYTTCVSVDGKLYSWGFLCPTGQQGSTPLLSMSVPKELKNFTFHKSVKSAKRRRKILKKAKGDYREFLFLFDFDFGGTS